MCCQQLEKYIFNCINRFDSAYNLHKEDVLQEIAIAVFLSKDEKEALRMANRNCQRLLRKFGYRKNGVRQRYEAHVLYNHKLTQYQIIDEL